MERLKEAATLRLESNVDEIGFGAVTREDSAYMVGDGYLRRNRIPEGFRRPIVEGDVTRDWAINDPIMSIWPYDAETLKAEGGQSVKKALWPVRCVLVHRVAYGSTQIERGLTWFEYSMFFTKRYRVPLSIPFAFVATHNHFVLDRGGKVFKQSVPVIKLPPGATEDDHLRLLGVLNSSVACFWLKQVSHNKGRPGAEQAGADEPWEHRYEFTGTKLQEFPLPRVYPTERARELDYLAQRLATLTPSSVADLGVPTRQRLADARREYDSVRARMIAVQEELDWEVYRHYGLIDEDMTTASPPGISSSERAFAMVLASQIDAKQASTTWFTHHNHKFAPIPKP
ncbi:BREX-2 system adenine-specific DNA-methyltransferase PglX, partial [Streptomyces sp. NPDC003333]